MVSGQYSREGYDGARTVDKNVGLSRILPKKNYYHLFKKKLNKQK